MRVAAVLLLAGCGRIAFEPLGDAGGFAHSTLTLAVPAAPLADFPVPVILDDTRAARERIGDGSDLRFLDATGHVLPHELEQLGSPGGPPLIAWVRVPLIDGPTTLEVRYGGATGPASTDVVWTADFAAVWHFASDGVALDSTANHRDAMPSGTQVDAGMISNGRSFDRSASDYLVVPSLATFGASAQTISGWISPRTIASWHGMVTRQVGTSSDNDIYLGINVSQAVTTCENAAREYDAMGGSVAAQTFVYLAGVATATDETLYVDGTQVAQIAVPGPLVAASNPVFIGADRSSSGGTPTTPTGDFVDGIVDEVRIAGVARQPAWIQYDALAQRDQVITYGPVVAAP